MTHALLADFQLHPDRAEAFADAIAIAIAAHPAPARFRASDAPTRDEGARTHALQAP